DAGGVVARLRRWAREAAGRVGMKCIRCDHDSKYPERKNRKCPKCGGTFAFEPREGDPLTDPAFRRVIEVVSSHGRVRWGVERLYYEVCRRKRFPQAAPVILAFVAVVLVVMGLSLGLTVKPGFLVLLLIGVGFAAGAYGVHRASRVVRVDRDTFRRLYDRWV